MRQVDCGSFARPLRRTLPDRLFLADSWPVVAYSGHLGLDPTHLQATLRLVTHHDDKVSCRPSFLMRALIREDKRGSNPNRFRNQIGDLLREQ